MFAIKTAVLERARTVNVQNIYVLADKVRLHKIDATMIADPHDGRAKPHVLVFYMRMPNLYQL